MTPDAQTFGPMAVSPAGWKPYTSPRWRVSFSLPPDWQTAEEDSFIGADGFVRVELFAGPGVSVDQACEWEANAHRERYGKKVALLSLPSGNEINFRAFPCLILGEPGKAATVHSAILLPAPAAEGTNRFVILAMDTAHALQIAQSVSYRLAATPQPPLSGNSYLATPAPETVPTDLPRLVSQFEGLVLEEYAVIDAGVDAPGHFEFSQRIPPAVLSRRSSGRSDNRSRLPRDPVEVAGHWISVEEASDAYALAGDTLYSDYVSVRSDGQEIYRYDMLQHVAVFPLYYLGNWDGHWVVEANGMLIMDGEIVNLKWGHDEIFGCQELHGRPFYFFVQNGKTHLSYDGQVLPVEYDDVFHGGCCEPAAFNATGNDSMVWFYALREGAWQYVELGAYQ